MENVYYLPAAAAAAAAGKSRDAELLRVAVALNAGRSAAEIMDLLFDHLDGLVPFDRISLALLEPGGTMRAAHVRSKLPIQWGVGAQAPLAGTSLEPIVRERKIRVIEDLAAFVREHPGSKTAPLLLAEGMHASLTLPLTVADGPLGVMFFSSRHPGAYGPPDSAFLSLLAEAIATALARARLADQLQAAHEALATLDTLKANFLGNLSHELRTPLTRILANVEALADEAPAALAPAHRRYVAEIEAGAVRLAGLLDTFFDYTALEAKRLVVSKVPVDVAAIAEELAGELGPAIEAAGLDFSLAVHDAPLLVEADPPRLAQVVRALLDNARKFTPAPGAVRVRVGRTGDLVWLEVHDTGIGISAGDQAHVFDKFFQVEDGAARRFAGTGLGLALAREIVLAHGGTIQVNSTAGLGSVFTVNLPALA